MKIEVLFPEICNLYGDLGNIRYLEKTVDKTKVINTHLTDECGLTPEGDWPENMKHNYQSDRDWMISCISKYFNALKDTGWKFEPPTLYTLD